MNFKERLEIARAYVQGHKSEMVILGVMFGITVAVSIALASGDVGEAVARGRNR